jgi:hypothetical protein
MVAFTCQQALEQINPELTASIMLLLPLGKHLTLATIMKTAWHPGFDSPMQPHLSGVAFAVIW